MLEMDSDESAWLTLAGKMRRSTLLGQMPSVRRKGNSLVIGVNRMAGCIGIGALVLTVVGGVVMYLPNPQDVSDPSFRNWVVIGAAIGLLGVAAGFRKTGLYYETGDKRLTVGYGFLRRRRQLAVADLSADLVAAEKRFGSSVPRGHIMLVLRHKDFAEAVPLASAPTRADLKTVLDALAEILGAQPSDQTAAVLETRDGEEISISRASCSSGSFNYRTHVFCELSSDEAVFRPTLRGRLVAGLILAVALATLGFMLPSAVLDGSILGAALCFVVGGSFLLVGWMFIPRRMRIIVNRSARIVRITGARRRSEASDEPFSLRDIVAVQICLRRESGSSRYTARELNLVLKKPNVHRINLMCHSNRRALHADAQRLADFLGKPLLDHSAGESEPYKRKPL